MSTMSDVENVIIIGGGAAGLSAAIYLARAGLKPLLFAGSPPGGQLTVTSEVENFPGHTSILGAELIDKMRKQAQQFGTQIRDENVLKVSTENTPFVVESLKGTVKAKTILIATGAKALWLGLESEKKLRGKGVSACATCDGFFFKDKDIAVIGGGDTALEEALTLTKFARKVYIIHRRDSFKASKIMQERVIHHPKISIVWNARVSEIVGEAKVEGIRVAIKDEKEESIAVQGVFVAIGHKPDTDLFKGMIELDEKGYVITTQRLGFEVLKLKTQTNPKSTNQESKWEQIISKFNNTYQTSTSIQGVFSAGDCVDSVYRQATTAAGMGVAASLDIERWLENQK